MATARWITVGFVPATTPLYVHRVNPYESGNATLTDEVVGWLVQHKYDDEKASPVNSRVIAGVVSDGQVFPAKEAVTMPVGGVYRADETPNSAYVEAARQSRTNS